ncbi:MAG: ribonuclease P protein component [Dehalococcoidia bacterium]|jgi:ribonuclease P protein component|nr:ribonuclease P protein component [Dehalococcoidia bacterium]|tara:strand:+ start:239 stop:583 length:345 start_codon:yes stop_codon:yes gene_type:complete
MQKELRLRKSKDFSDVYRLGRSWANDLLVLKVLAADADGVSRCGFAVGKRTGNAVVRNTIKRRLREAVRHTPAKCGWDMIFIARGKARSADYHQLKTSVRGLLRRADLLAVSPR